MTILQNIIRKIYLREGSQASLSIAGNYQLFDFERWPKSERLPGEQECHGGRILLMKKLLSVRQKD